jgi:hypothetical protein
MNFKNTKIAVLVIGGFYAITSLFAYGILYAQNSFFTYMEDKLSGVPKTQLETITFLWESVRDYMPYLFVFGLLLLLIGFLFEKFIKQAYLAALGVLFPFSAWVYLYAQRLKGYDEISKRHLEETFASLEHSPVGQNMIGWAKTMNSGSVSNQSYLLVFPLLLAIYFLYKQRNVSLKSDEQQSDED